MTFSPVRLLDDFNDRAVTGGGGAGLFRSAPIVVVVMSAAPSSIRSAQ
jgi:hypothetical protein